MKLDYSTEVEEFYMINEGLMFIPSVRTIHQVATGRRVQLTNIVNKMFYYLCQNNGKVISYDEIMQFVWGERHRQISYGSLYQALLTLRKSLKEVNVDGDSIKSIRKKGMIFNAVVEKKIQKTPSSSNKIRHLAYTSRIFFSLIALLMIILILCSGLYFIYNGDEVKIFNNYFTAKNTPGGCKVKFNSDAANSRKHNSFLHDHIYLCVPDTVMYITAYENISNISVVQCQDNYLDTKKMGNCRVYIF
ncbi:winged helix-turn-helix domain-containing protein [Enterobacter hormaechei]